MTLEGGLTALEELSWDLGGLLLPSDAAGIYGIVGDDGLDDITTDTQDLEGGNDGDYNGHQRIGGRGVTLFLSLSAPGNTDGDRATAMAAGLHSLGLVTQPLPDRIGSTRMLRWRRRGEVAKRLYYRPANGAALKVAGDEARLKYDSVDLLELHLDCPDPVVVSDEYTDIVFTAGQTRTITNNGTLAALAPSLGYTISAASTVTVTNDTYGGGVIYPVPSGGLLYVDRRHVVQTVGVTPTYAQYFGSGLTPFVQPITLYPGPQDITCSAACTIRKWDTW